jgi:serine protease Do
MTKHRPLSAVAALVLVSLAAPWAGAISRASAPASKPASGPASKPAEESSGIDDQFRVAEEVAAGMVRVELTLQFDKGESPSHELILQERPFETEGFLVAPDKVICDDILIHPRFIKDVHVRAGEEVVKARFCAWGRARAYAMLELAEPLKKARPLVFDASKKGPYLAVGYSQFNAEWTVSAGPLQQVASITEKGRRFVSGPANALVTDRDGVPVGLLVDRQMPADANWKGSPLDWPVVSAGEMDKTLKSVEALSQRGILRVSMSFRSPRKSVQRASRYSAYAPGEDAENDSTERNVIGVLVAKQKMLVLADLTPKVTARLEKIMVHPPKGPAVAARFDGTLANYGAMLASLETPLDGAIELSPDDALGLRDGLLYGAEIILQGENRTTYFHHGRVSGFRLGWRRQVYPEASGRGYFEFDAKARLAMLPIVRREKAGARDRYGAEPRLETAAVYVKGVLDAVSAGTDLARHLDRQNVPLTEQEESRLAWLGVELQPLDRELARANNVSELTGDGQTGSIVSYVYDGSPADKKGIRTGDILLRLHVQDEPKPLDIRVEEGLSGRFPWARWDELPEEMYDRFPTPWQPAENDFTRTLTDMGFGKKYTLDFFRDGNTESREFTIVEGPQHYESAPRYKHEPTGITVRDITYEVRRYFQMDANSPGVVISMLSAGGKGSVAGLKPFEIVTRVNDQPVFGVKDFENVVKGQAELRLNVLRVNKGRTVPIPVGAATRSAAPAARSMPATRAEE